MSGDLTLYQPGSPATTPTRMNKKLKSENGTASPSLSAKGVSLFLFHARCLCSSPPSYRPPSFTGIRSPRYHLASALSPRLRLLLPQYPWQPHPRLPWTMNLKTFLHPLLLRQIGIAHQRQVHLILVLRVELPPGPVRRPYLGRLRLQDTV